MWHLYMLRLQDGSIYTGITLDVKERVKTHSRGRGSKYVASHLPIREWTAMELGEAFDYSAALKEERRVKAWSHAKKAVWMVWPFTEARPACEEEIQRG